MRVSVIVCTYNRGKLIRDTIESILKSAEGRESVELLLIDNNSTDNTREILVEFRNDPRVRYFFEENQGLSNARNRGLHEANGDIIAFLDDDIELEENYFDVLYSVFEDEGVNLIGGKVLPYKVNIPEWLPSRFYYLVSVFDIGDAKKVVPLVMGGHCAMRRKMTKDVGAFDVNLGRKGGNLMGAEETDYFSRAAKLGYKAHYIPDFIIYHKINDKLNKNYVFGFAYMHGVSDSILYKKNDRLKYYLKKIKALIEVLKYYGFITFLRGDRRKMHYLIQKKYSLGYIFERGNLKP